MAKHRPGSLSNGTNMCSYCESAKRSPTRTCALKKAEGEPWVGEHDVRDDSSGAHGHQALMRNVSIRTVKLFDHSLVLYAEIEGRPDNMRVNEMHSFCGFGSPNWAAAGS